MTAVGTRPQDAALPWWPAIVEIGMYEYDSSLAYTSLAAAQEFAGLGDRVTGIEVKLADPFRRARRVAASSADARAGPTGCATGWT